MSLKEAMSKANAIGEKQFINLKALTVAAIDQTNRDAIENPIPMKDRSGNDFLAITKKQIDNPNQVELTIINQKTGKQTHLNSWQDATNLGFTKTNLDDEKKRADINATNALTNYREQQLKNAKNPKGKKTVQGLKYAEEQAEKNISAAFKSIGVPYNPEERVVMVPVGKDGKPENMDVLNTIDQSGFGFTTGKPVMTKDKWGPNNEYSIPVYIGAFNPGNKSNQQKTDQGAQPSGEGKNAGSVLSDLLSRIDKKPAGSNPQAQQNSPEAQERMAQYKYPSGSISTITGKPINDGQQENGLPSGPQSDIDSKKYGLRKDGTQKGDGFLGKIKNPDGSVSTELSIGVKIGGEEVDIPLLIPTLTEKELKMVLSIKDPNKIPKAIIDKAVKHAQERMDKGLSPFA